jgi:hypothetical protein
MMVEVVPQPAVPKLSPIAWSALAYCLGCARPGAHPRQ